ncbi:MAG: serine--tRNA ligase [Anaerolineales bacterium]|jgi:seryl-tRNA synthetase|nr:serine--tRNA ligase [Anaerolineales bacterium]MDP7643561.1 serine--tRNA ligase [Anaerolineales bacterium]HJN41652.1 serine--tRNA ligase [Anaerolineales bacterium]|tara:strand:- start:3151 stop:4419 length:1269 start_codon:yes stop_codon:yes gene_type:complete
MLDINFIRQNPEEVRAALALRRAEADLEGVLALDRERRELLQQTETLKSERNRVSKEIGRMKAASDREERIAEMRSVGDRISSLDEQVRAVETRLRALLLEIPNMPEPGTPLGESDDDNVTVREVGARAEFDFTPKPHWEIGTELSIIDFERGVKLSGSRFYVLNDAGARLQRALISFMLAQHARQGYAERYLPFMVKEINFEAAGQLPKFVDNIYHDAEDDAWFVTTAEVPLTNLHRDEILAADELPLYYTAYTPCFRREKVAAGKDVRGIKRGHQFDKVEMYAFTRPEQSADALQKMVADVEKTCAELGLPYRVRQLCSGDLGFGSRITYDIEAWAPGCDEWLEVSSVSNCGDFQARRANARFRPKKGAKPTFVHTLNGSGLGLPRTLIAVLENYQQADGSVEIPEALRPWMPGEEVIRA